MIVGVAVGCSVRVVVAVGITVGDGAKVDEAIGFCEGSTGVLPCAQAVNSSKPADMKISRNRLRENIKSSMRYLPGLMISIDESRIKDDEYRYNHTPIAVSITSKGYPSNLISKVFPKMDQPLKLLVAQRNVGSQAKDIIHQGVRGHFLAVPFNCPGFRCFYKSSPITLPAQIEIDKPTF
jgi:hypothetical protein